ncbi:hypothetical protein [Gimesia chilikensis]|uniref:hypothetical protein n=1 Tax=Gimesia chilikensis TaxID=2605989 RepID=UPI003A953F3C
MKSLTYQAISGFKTRTKKFESICMFQYLRLAVLISGLLVSGCDRQAQHNITPASDSESNVTPEKSEPTEVVEVKEKEILKPGKLQVEVPEDFPLPESAIVAMGTKLGSSGKKHFYIQIPDMESAQKVTEYFAVELPKHGWELLNGKGEERIANTISLDFKNENELGRVDSIIKQERAGTIVHVHLEPIKK